MDEDSRALLDAEVEGFPPAIWNAMDEMAAVAAEKDIDFAFESAAVESRTDFARQRRIRFTFDVTERGINVVLQHTPRHPSWLPEVVLPTPVGRPRELVGVPA